MPAVLARALARCVGLTPALASLVAGACAQAAASGGGGGAPDPGRASGPGAAEWSEPGAWRREVSPFPVTGPGGIAFDHAFLGGFNQPRPQLADIDGDGDDDLFVQEATGSVMHFERLDGREPRFRWRKDRFEDLDVGEWYRFVDLDGDGDLDLLAETPFSYVRFYRNEGGPSSPRFALAADTVRDADGRPIFSDRQNIPNAADIDCDGLADLLIGRLEGTVTHYEEDGADAAGVPLFRLVTERFEGIEIVAQFGSLHGANTMALGDVDGDGDVDLFWGDFFEAGLLFIENRGSCARPSLRTEPRRFPLDDPLVTSGYNAPALGDLDGDGDLDLVVGVLGGAFNPNTTTVDNLYHLEQMEDGRFRHRTSRLIGQIDVGSESVPAFVDVDGDGDLDLLLANKIAQHDPDNGEVHRYLNVGGASDPSLRWDGVVEELAGGYHFAPAFGDLDGDGDLDAVVGTWQDRLRLYRNDGSAGGVRLALADSAYLTLTRGRNATPALGDLDGDGDLDLVVGESSGSLNFYRNEGSPTEPRFELVSDEWLGVRSGRRSFPVLEDLDGDADLDLLVGYETGPIRVHVNEGTPGDPRFRTEPDTLPVPTFGFAAPAFVDLDGDGRRDLVLGGTGGGLWYFRRR